MSLSVDRVVCKERIGVERAQTVQTTVVVKAGPSERQRVITLNTKCVSMSKSRVTGGWMSQRNSLSARRQCQNSTTCFLLHVLCGVHACGAAPGVPAPQASEVGMPCCKCPVLGGFVSLKIWTHLLFYSCVVRALVWVLLKVELCMASSPRKLCVLARHLLVVHAPQLWPHVSQNMSGACIVWVSKMQTNPQAHVMENWCLSIGYLSHLSNLSR